MEASARRTWGGLEKLFLLRIIFPWLPLASNRLALAFTRLINAKKTSFPQASCVWEKWYPMITCQTSNSTAKPLTNNFNFSVFFFFFLSFHFTGRWCSFRREDIFRVADGRVLRVCQYSHHPRCILRRLHSMWSLVALLLLQEDATTKVFWVRYKMMKLHRFYSPRFILS